MAYTSHSAQRGTAGGDSVQSLAKKIHECEYHDLSGTQKECIREEQRLTHCWAVEHNSSRVFAIGERPCERHVSHLEGARLEPCDACLSVFSSGKFKTAPNADVPEDDMRLYTPHVYQNPALGNMHARNKGLKLMFDEVSTLYAPSSRPDTDHCHSLQIMHSFSPTL